ncbi:conserved hypothetical protein, partial [Listeria innocua FSL S4-378]
YQFSKNRVMKAYREPLFQNQAAYFLRHFYRVRDYLQRLLDDQVLSHQ